jgi:hypothetical protein
MRKIIALLSASLFLLNVSPNMASSYRVHHKQLARQSSRLSMARAKQAITAYNGPTATLGSCWRIRISVVDCNFNEPYEENWTFYYHAVARLIRNHIVVEWPGWLRAEPS